MYPQNTDKGEFTRTLLANNFHIETSVSKPGYLHCEAWRVDEFGTQIKYLFALADQDFCDTNVRALQGVADAKKLRLVIVAPIDGSQLPPNCAALTMADFYGRLGGVVPQYLVLEPDYETKLEILGKNVLPNGMRGRPDTLYESYVHTGLQFLLPARVIAYGQDRRFEALPDGLGLEPTTFNFLYDAKAAGDGYEVTSTTIRQFKDYVDDFHRRYAASVGRLYCFTVVSTEFQGSPDTLEERSRELYSECSVRLVFLRSKELARLVNAFIAAPAYRRAIDWRRAFSRTIIDAGPTLDELETRKKDGVLR